MYETHTDDPIDQLMGLYETAVAAVGDFDRLVDVVLAQLAANGEGHGDFRIALAVREVATGADVAWHLTELTPTPARPTGP
jgi:hypothetical protein